MGKYEIDVRVGKPLDIASLKKDVINNFSTHLARINSSRSSLFGSEGLEKVSRCPACGSSSGNSDLVVSVYKARYHKCRMCGHVFLIRRPSKADLDRFYAKDNRYASTYADKKSLITRTRQVVAPKLKWTLERFRELYGRRPASILDVGAGAGHFVHSCKRAGIDACGVELSRPCIDFCINNFGIQLKPNDFIKDWRLFSNADTVTFWGVIEHVPDPVILLRAAHKVLSEKDGLVVVEVPRWDSISTQIQCVMNDSVVRHLDPLGHINVFTDNSLITIFERSGFEPVAAWYFGMDGYELLMQLYNMAKNDKFMRSIVKYSGKLQKKIDRALASDTIILVGKPVK